MNDELDEASLVVAKHMMAQAMMTSCGTVGRDNARRLARELVDDPTFWIQAEMTVQAILGRRRPGGGEA